MSNMYLKVCAGLLMAVVFSGPLLALEPYTATYKLKRGPLTVGETRYELTIGDDGEVLFRTHAETSGLVSLIRNDEIIEQSRLRLDDQNRLIAMEYEYRHQRGETIEEERHIEFDWDNNVAVSRVDDESWKIPISPGTIDRMSLQLRVMQDAKDGMNRSSMVYKAIDEDEIEEFEFRLADELSITTPAGEFHTRRLERKHGSRTTIFWVAREVGYLPVRVEQRREDRATISLELETLSGPLAAATGKE